ncbi:MAG: zf-TFIIB domain-containing protein [Candidatus Riflebacteria bacterium]|nr:zf-TFIIB domain-containing protein [Candidatus Riflebacteria bacterium]
MTTADRSPGSKCRSCQHAVPAGAVRCLFCGELQVAPAKQQRRTCPRCHKAMTPTPTQWIVVDRCDQCRGEFYDVGEADRLLVLDPTQRAWLQRNAVRRAPDTPDRKPLRCPGCTKNMQTFELPGPSPVLVDLCPGCDGLWLDQGELDRIRDVARARIVPKAVAGSPAGPLDASAPEPEPVPDDDGPVSRWFHQICRFVTGAPSDR